MSHPQPTAASTSRPPWTIRVATVFGIPIRIHATFLLFLAWVSVINSSANGIAWTLFIVAVFVCVLLHELGHALVARRFGVHTKDITLYPIGGVAVLEGRPKPKQELWIALAGPMVNVVLSVVLVGFLFVFEGGFSHLMGGAQKITLLDFLLVANVTLALFNLIPAFPMDGGRVLRAALAMAMPEARATQIAGGIGQGLAFVIGLIGVLQQSIVLMLIAFFIFLGASQEISSTVTRSFLQGHTMADAMQTRFRTIMSGDSLERAANMLLDGSQHDFPVINGDEVLGILMRNNIVQGLSMDGPSAYVASVMQREFKSVSPDAPLESAFELFPQADPSPILIFKEDRLIGMLTLENLSEFVMLEHAKARSIGR
ncbi:MAG: site-2 protease family protein [Fimbriimonas sp.]|nr:site-2 protease family protein [Fimbriimonas sp.]